MRKIAVVTVSRSDYSIYLQILHRIQADPDLALSIIAGGTHLSNSFGASIEQIKSDGFRIVSQVETVTEASEPESIAKSMAMGIRGFAQAYANIQPDILLLVGDRFEMHSAASAAIPFNIPVAHIHGGELTQGATDDAMRHSITKLSHLHFVSTPEHRNRVMQMGEEPWRITVSGAPSLDNLEILPLTPKEEIYTRFGLELTETPILVTYHPVTLDHQNTKHQTDALLAALSEITEPIIFTMPNVDLKSDIIRTMINKFSDSRENVQAVENLGPSGYFSLMKYSSIMVGNSSSGIIEAASFKLPVVNIGTRQSGRTRGINVIDVDCNKEDILSGIALGTSQKFVSTISDMINPYGNGNASVLIVNALKQIDLNESLLRKQFQTYDIRQPL